MPSKVIAIEETDEAFRIVLQSVMRAVPDRDENDIHLQRLLAFRLRIDGEAALREYLLRKIQAAIRCGYTGSLYAFLKDDLPEKECRAEETGEPPVPGVA